MQKFFLKTFFLCLFFARASAEEWREFYSNARALGMGNASLAVTNDETALLLNPAALGRLRDYYGTLLDPEIETTSNSTSQLQGDSLSNTFDTAKAYQITSAHRDTYYHQRAQAFPSFVKKYFGVGLLYRTQIDAQMNTGSTNMYLNSRNDLALVGGLSVRLFDGRIKLGVNTKIISRIEVQNQAVDTTGALDLTTVGASEGVGISTDVGFLAAGPWTWLPTLGVVVRDVGGTTFDKRTGVRGQFATTPKKIEQQIDVAVAVFPIHSNDFRSSWTVEYKDATYARTDTDAAKRFHVGLETNYADIFFFRLGYNQRYWTTGFELASEHWQWQLASYGEEIGTDTAPIEDRRYVLKVALRF